MTGNAEETALAAKPQVRVLSSRVSPERRGAKGGDESGAALDPPRMAVVGAAALVVVLAVLAGCATYLNVRERRIDDRAREAQTVVAANMTRLLSWDADNLDAEVGEEMELLTGDFADQYEQLVRENIAPAAKKAGLSAEASVAAQGVIDASLDRVELLYFVNVSMTGAGARKGMEAGLAEGVVGSRIKVTAEWTDGAWRISSYDPI